MWGQQVVVETKAGAAGVIAADYVSQLPGDGSTLLMAHINSHALAPSLQPKLRYNAERDFVPIVLVGVTPNLLIGNTAQPAKTVKDIVALCKAKPGQISFGSAGAGSAQHLALEMFKLQAKVDALHVPYKGSGPLLTDLIGGQIQYSFETMTAATPHVANGRVDRHRADAHPRAKGHPNVPTMQEQGFEASRRPPGTAWSARRACRRRSRRRSTPTSTPCWRCPTCRKSSTPTAPRTAAARPTSSPLHPHRDREVGEGREGRRRQARQLTVLPRRRGAARRAAQSYLRVSSITLPSFGRLPGARTATSPRSLVTSRIVPGDALGQALGRGAFDLDLERHPVVGALAAHDQPRLPHLGMAARDLGHLRRMDEHAAHLGRLVGAAEPAADALVGAAGRAAPGQHRRKIAGAEADQRVIRVERRHDHLADLAVGDRIARAGPHDLDDHAFVDDQASRASVS
jgi:hypothetical protein